MAQTHLSKILTRRYDVGREIKFILYKDELLSDPIDLTDYTVVITVIKPDNNFVIENFVGDTVTITEQMEVVTGTGYYCVHVSKDNETIYTGQGEFIIDDVLISDDELESISEVNGLRFPDDFLTIDDHVAVIDDDVTRTDKTWSSSKISYEIENVSVIVSKIDNGNPIELTDAADAPLVKCVTTITGYQSGTGTPSPDNIRPITAYTEGEIEVGGRNLYPIKIGDDYFSPNVGGSTSNDNGTLVVTTTSASYSGVYTATNSIFYNMTKELVGKFTYSFYAKSSVNLRAILGITNYGRGEFNLTTTWQRISMTATFPGTKLAFLIYSLGTAGNIYIKDFMVERGDTAHDYEEYITPISHTTTYPSAIYRGSEDVVNGTATTEWGMIASYAGETLPGEWISDRDEYVPGTTPTTGAQVAYELATTATSSVTTTNLPIKSLSGYNHIVSSTGDMEIEYITHDYQPLVDSIEKESGCRTTKLWDAGFTPSPGVWLEYDFGEDLENYDALVIELVVSGWEGDNSDTVTIYPKLQHLNTKHCYHYVKGTDYGIQFWRVSGTTYGLGSINGNYPPQYKAVYGIKY